MAQAENYCQSLDQATATGRCSTFHIIAILHEHYRIHALASKKNVVCTRTIYLPPPPPTVTSQFSTLTCDLVKSTASLAEDAILFHANHIEVTLHFYLYGVSELNTHKYLRERSERKYL